MLNAVVLQIPDALALWLRSTLVQKVWLSLFAGIGGFGFCVLLLQFFISALWYRVTEQINNPMDMDNALIIVEYLVWIFCSGVCCRLGWIAILVYVRAVVHDLIIFVKYLFLVSWLSAASLKAFV
jgi:hypothetical protein